MKLGLLKGTGVVSSLIRARLVSQYSHSALLINGGLYQSTPTRGVHVTTVDPSDSWDWFEIPEHYASEALNRFRGVVGRPYDLIGATAFILPWRVGSTKNFYCHELCAYLLGLEVTKQSRVTPETLLKFLAA
jgi:hypothetical protein